MSIRKKWSSRTLPVHVAEPIIARDESRSAQQLQLGTVVVILMALLAFLTGLDRPSPVAAGQDGLDGLIIQQSACLPNSQTAWVLGEDENWKPIRRAARKPAILKPDLENAGKSPDAAPQPRDDWRARVRAGEVDHLKQKAAAARLLGVHPTTLGRVFKRNGHGWTELM